MPTLSRVALVTGGARGIGLGISRRLAAEGWSLAIGGTRAEADARPALDELRAASADVLYVQASVADRADRSRLIGDARRRFGRIDALVNNAGIAPRVRADILDATEESFEELIRTNLQGPYFLTQAIARWMIEERAADSAFRGCIVNISSVSSTAASVNRGDYCISKAGISMATRLWAVRLAEHGIAVYEVRPGVIDTDMTAVVHERYDRLIDQGLLLQARWGQPEDVGGAVAMLLRGDLPYSTGQVIMVDGGMTVDRL